MKTQLLNDIEILDYFNGNKLYGDDFSIDEIKEWYKEEKEAYANLGSNNRIIYTYTYHHFNTIHGFNLIERDKTFENALGFGSAWGLEFEPVINRINKLTILEPSSSMINDKIGEITPNYVEPNIDGKIDFESNYFDLITCFGTLHHVPNVKYVLNELIRVLKPNGYLLIREPIVTQGDWRKNRLGLTKNERGIPVKFFDDIFQFNKLEIINRSFCFCGISFITRIVNKVIPNFNIHTNKIYVLFDKYLSKMLSWNVHYHPMKKAEQIAPDSIFYVLRKR